MSSKTAEEVVATLRSLIAPKAIRWAARIGIDVPYIWVYGARIAELAKEIVADHGLRARNGGRVFTMPRLAALIDDPALVTESQMELWARDFIRGRLRRLCGCLFDKTPYAWDKAIEWSRRDAEYVKRAGFVLMASLAVHDKKAPDERFEAFLPLIVEQAGDERNFVKKAVN